MTDTYDVTNPTKPTILKDPNAILDYTFDWTVWLADVGGDTILTKLLILDAPLVEVSSNIVGGTKVVVFISGGTVNATHRVVCRITTAALRTDDRSIYLKIRER